MEAESNRTSDGNKRKRLLNTSGLYWKIPVIILGIIGVWSAASDVNEYDNLPSCDSGRVERTIKQNFGNIPAARIQKVSAVDVFDFEEESFEEDKHRTCLATVMTSIGGNVKVRIRFFIQRDKEFYELNLAGLMP